MKSEEALLSGSDIVNAICIIPAGDWSYVSAVEERLSAFNDGCRVNTVFDVLLTCVWIGIEGCIIGQDCGCECFGRE